MQSVIKGILFTILLGFFTVAVAHEVSADICTFSGGITAYRVSDKGDWFPAIVKCDEETIRVYAQKTNLLIARFGRDDTVRVGMDLTRFGGYLMSNQKGDPLCHQHVPLIQPS